MNSAKTQKYVNLRTTFLFLHSTSSIYSLLSASMWSIICKWLRAVVPFLPGVFPAGRILKKTAQGRMCNYKYGQWPDRNGKIPWRQATFFNMTQCKSLQLDAHSFSLSLYNSFSHAFHIFSLCLPASHPLCCPFAGILSKIEMFFPPCVVAWHLFFSCAAHNNRLKGEKWGENDKKKREQTKSKLRVNMSVSLLCLGSFSAGARLNIWIKGVCTKSDGSNVDKDMTKLDGWLPSVAVQTLPCLQANSFEIELEQELFWRSGQLPRGLIRDFAWCVDRGSGAQPSNAHTQHGLIHNLPMNSHMLLCSFFHSTHTLLHVDPSRGVCEREA